MQADPDLSLEVRLLLQILGVCSSHLVSSASNVPEVPGREEYQKDDWPQVLLPFIFVKVVSGCVKIVSLPVCGKEGDVISRSRYCWEQPVLTPVWELPRIPAFWCTDGVQFEFYIESFVSTSASSCPPPIHGQCCLCLARLCPVMWSWCCAAEQVHHSPVGSTVLQAIPVPGSAAG